MYEHKTKLLNDAYMYVNHIGQETTEITVFKVSGPVKFDYGKNSEIQL